MTKVCVLLALVLAFSGRSSAQGSHPKADQRPLKTEEIQGGSIVTNLSFRAQLNKGSSLQRRWFVVNDPSSPVQLNGAGVKTVYVTNSIGGDYSYIPDGTANCTEPVTAYEIRFMLFDIWGDHVKTLSGTQITDSSGQIALKNIGSWRAWENDASELMTVVSFVARARKADGSSWEADMPSLLTEIQKVKVRLTENELTPEKDRPKN